MSQLKGKKNKVDYQALHSSFMKLPRMDVVTARALLDKGFVESYQLEGVCPESLFSELKENMPSLPIESLYRLRLAVFAVESADPDPSELKLEAWSY